MIRSGAGVTLPLMAFVSCWKAAFASATTPMSRRRGEFAISDGSMSMRTIFAAAFQRGGAACPIT